MRLDSIAIEGFKSIASVELPLGAINVLIGPNGSGKSNFIGVFGLLNAVRSGQLKQYVSQSGGAEKLLHFGSKATKEIRLDLKFDETGRYKIRLAPTADDSLYPVEEQKISDPLSSYNWGIYHLHDTSTSSPMRKTTSVHDNGPLRSDGSNLAAFLYLLRERHESSYALIRKTVQRVAPFFDDFQLKPLNLRPEDIKLEWRHCGSDQYFDASALSDGTLRFIALATLFLQPERYQPPLIIVDEPELGLHPYAIEILASMIKHASTKTQVIVAAQSSLLLDHFAPEDVLVGDRVEGSTRITRLDPSRLAKWLEDYSLGQLWEKNELGGRPVPN